jgi:ATP-dependent Lhr-like helicase
MPLENFHPAVNQWFTARFPTPTAVQDQAWPAIAGRQHTLMAAPTGSGKTLAAFLAVIDDLVRQNLEQGLRDETQVLYVSPLKALSNDIQKNLQEPLLGIRDELLMQGLPDAPIRAAVRTGDTPQSERARMVKRPPHILVTTPESLYILLTSDSGRRMLSTVRTVIVDEVHAVAGNKRGSHLSLSLERLEGICASPPVRVGISATQKPLSRMAKFLLGNRDEACTIVDTGHVRRRDLKLALTSSPLEPVMANEVWGEIYDRIAALAGEYRTTLVFVNTRRLAERAARHIAERLGEENVTSHHGSLAKEHRLRAEQRLKAGELKVLVATASLELGIDIGDVDLVCQLGSPRGIATLLQRVGRSGHGVDSLPRGRLFPLSRDDLVECTALLDAVQREELDQIVIPTGPKDVLAQQIVAEVSAGDRDITELYDRFVRAYPYRDLPREEFDAVLMMLAKGFSTQRGRRGAYLHLDAVNGKVKPRRSARLTAITNGGAIPDQFDYDVVLLPEELPVGRLNEDFAFESLPGDIFQLGNTSYRIIKVDPGKVFVEDAKGQPPNIPFWFGEAPGRTDELSFAVSRLRTDVDKKLAELGAEGTAAWLMESLGLDASAASQLVDYLGAARAALDGLPTQQRIVLERFFDESGDTHLVIHSPFGSRLNRAWGLALRKKFCRRFNFELQAAALEDTIVLSLGPTHSFVLGEVIGYLNSSTVKETLVQALLDAPIFPTHWRFNASIALAIKRFQNGRRTPPVFQRNDSEDLLAVVFPDQLACAENLTGQREVPDHPLVEQTITDCITQVMDVEALITVLKAIEAKQLQVDCRELTTPSPLAQEVLAARPYAFLDDAPAEERRTLAVQGRRYMSVAEAEEIGQLDPAAVERVRDEAWPDPRDIEELHDGLVVLGFATDEEASRSGWLEQLQALADSGRATAFRLGGSQLWVSAERLAELELACPQGKPATSLKVFAAPADKETAVLELIRSRLECLGPTSAEALATPLALSASNRDFTLAALENEGFAMQGHYSQNQTVEWCDRRLLARIHRYTLKTLRESIEPVPVGVYQRFLKNWQGVGGGREGTESLFQVIDELQGFPLAAAAWERDVLPARLKHYQSHLMDQLCSSGRVVWQRPWLTTSHHKGRQGPVAGTPVALFPRSDLVHWQALWGPLAEPELSATAAKVRTTLVEGGALFFLDIVQRTGALRVRVEEALGELVSHGLVTADGLMGLRALLTPASKRPGFDGRRRRRRRRGGPGLDAAGRWSLTAGSGAEVEARDEVMENIAWILLRRYGVLVRRVLEREQGLPSWRELLTVLRRLEARGEIRGGRFVSGLSGEQFALPDAVGELRKTKKLQKHGEIMVLSAADPLNLVGILSAGPRLPTVASHRLVLLDGIPVATQGAGDLQWLTSISGEDQWRIQRRLHTARVPAVRPAIS